MAILIPIILTIVQTAQIKENIQLTRSNKKHFWGEIPGKMDVLITQHYRMFNMTNPEEFMNGAAPNIEELNGYKYQEFDTFENVDYGNDVDYTLYRYAKRSSKIPWAKNVSDQDLITSVSVGALGGWYLIKHFSRQQLSIISLSILANALEKDLPLIAYSIALRALLVNEKVAYLTMFTPAGISEQQGSNIWNDPLYGMSNRVNLETWIRALQENMDKNQNFNLNVPYTSTLNILRNLFGLTDTQLTLLFSGHLLTTYQLITLLFYNSYECPTWDQQVFTCNPLYLAGLQWSNCSITSSPPAIPPLGNSIIDINNTVTGYPEMYYFYQQTGLADKLSGYEFTPELYLQLFDYNRTTGYPAYSEYGLLDVTHLQVLFENGWDSNYKAIAEQFNLTTEGAQVLWDYVNSIVDYTGLQGCYDASIYDYDNRGISTEAALGQTLSPTLFNFTRFLANSLLPNITTIYDTLRFQELGISCSSILPPSFPSICNNFKLSWSDGGLAIWIQVHWNGINSTYWNEFAEIGQLSYSQMEDLFDPNGVLEKNLTLFDIEIKQHYNCTNYGNVCSEWFLANKQWGQSYVTMNLPGIFSVAKIENSTSVTNYPFFKSKYSGTPEYGAYAISKNQAVLVNDSLIASLLSFTGLYTPLMSQKYFIQVFARNNSAISEIFGVSDPEFMTTYLRFFADQYFFGGLVKPKTVKDILFTDIDPLTLYQINLSPLNGGNPGMSPTMSQVGLNFSKEVVLAPGNKFRSVINAGKHDCSDVRQYRKILGKPYINNAQKYYSGQLKNGEQNLTWINFNPWNGTISAKGTDAWQFKPFLSSDDHLYYYLDIGNLMFKLKFHEHKTYKGYKCLEYILDNEILKTQKEVPENAKWYQNAINGLTNQTGVFIAPVFGSKPYFYSGDDVLAQMVNFKNPENRKNRDLCESSFYVEKHAGMILKGRQLLQYNLEIRPDVLYPNLGRENLQKFGKKTYLPFVIYDRYASLKQHKIDDKLSNLKLVPKIKLASQIVGYTLFGVLLMNGIYLLWRRRKAGSASVRDPRLLEG